MIRQSNYIGLLGLLFAVFDVEATQVNLTGLKFNEQQPEKLVFELSGNVKHHYFKLDKPDRLVLDLENTRQLNKLMVSAPINHPLILNVRSSVRNSNDLRVVIELKSTVDAKTSLLEKAGGVLLNVDMHIKESLPKLTKEINKQVSPVVNQSVVTSVVASKKAVEFKSLKPRGREIIVAIDAGHGGKDVGAQGSNGTQEKDVVFAIAKRLEGYVNAQAGMEALMIRNGDYFVKLHDRVNIARAAKADLFVSIHADAFNDASAHGASVYTLAKKGASSEGARWLAESENASDKNAGAVDAGDDMLNSVLLDLSQTAAKEASLNVGNRVLNNIQNVSHLHRQSLQKAGFVVLKSQEFPSILVETAFISNPDEEQRLNSSAYQDKMASALFRGIIAHFKQYAPSNTLFAQLSKRGGSQLAKAGNTAPVVSNTPKPVAEAVTSEKALELVAAKSQHVINHGETLSGIAQQYGITMRALRLANGLEDGQVRVGQVLQIPNRMSRSS